MDEDKEREELQRVVQSIRAQYAEFERQRDEAKQANLRMAEELERSAAEARRKAAEEAKQAAEEAKLAAQRIEDEIEKKAAEDRRTAEEERRRDQIRQAWMRLALGAAMAATLATSAPILMKTVFLHDRNQSSGLDSQAIDQRINQLSADLRLSNAKLDRLTGKVPVGPQVQSDQSKEIKALDERLSRLEQAISNTPEKALSIPLLRKDVEGLSAKISENQARTDADVRQVTSTVNVILWSLISAMGVLILSGGGMLVRLMFSSRKRDET